MKEIDKVHIGEIYDEILEEGFKDFAKKAAIGAGILGTGLLGAELYGGHELKKQEDKRWGQEEQPATSGYSNYKFNNAELGKAFHDPTNVANLIKEFFKTKGKNVNVALQANEYVISGDANAKVSSKSLENLVDIARSGDLEGQSKIYDLVRYLEDNL